MYSTINLHCNINHIHVFLHFSNSTTCWSDHILMLHYLSPPDDFKPTVAHRDLNSRNVLIKSDLSCVIADLGFCMSAMGSKLLHKGRTENAEQTSLTDVCLVYLSDWLINMPLPLFGGAMGGFRLTCSCPDVCSPNFMSGVAPKVKITELYY